MSKGWTQMMRGCWKTVGFSDTELNSIDHDAEILFGSHSTPFDPNFRADPVIYQSDHQIPFASLHRLFRIGKRRADGQKTLQPITLYSRLGAKNFEQTIYHMKRGFIFPFRYSIGRRILYWRL